MGWCWMYSSTVWPTCRQRRQRMERERNNQSVHYSTLNTHLLHVHWGGSLKSWRCVTGVLLVLSSCVTGSLMCSLGTFAMGSWPCTRLLLSSESPRTLTCRIISPVIYDLPRSSSGVMGVPVGYCLSLAQSELGTSMDELSLPHSSLMNKSSCSFSAVTVGRQNSLPECSVPTRRDTVPYT